MGFWHTGYMEFHEPVGLDAYVPREPVPIQYLCSACSTKFPTVSELRKHAFERHKLARPAMFIRGREIGSAPVHISRSLSLQDFTTLRADAVSVNGERIAVGKLGRALAKCATDRVFVTLSHQGVDASFELIFSIAREDDLAGVERCVIEMIRNKRLDLREIQAFIDSARDFPSALRYCDGICQYLYGVLAKERAKDSGLQYRDYLDRWNNAADTLKEFERPLAAAVGALVAFHFNHFEDAAAMARGSDLGDVAGQYWGWVRGAPVRLTPKLADDAMNKLHNLFADLGTSRLLGWVLASPAARARALPEIQTMADGDGAEYDRAKAQILLAEHFVAAGELSHARRSARDLLNDPRLGSWAENLTQRLNTLEQQNA